MATVAFAIVGNAIFPGVGGLVGAVAGSLIDSYVLMPWLFPKPTLQGARLDDLSIQTASEGAPMRVFLGPLNRSAGQVIWKSPLIETKNTKRVGGSGSGAGQKYDNYTYSVHLAVHFGDARKIPVNRIVKIWADTKLIYDGTTASYCDAIRFYTGDQTDPDSLIESYRGAGNTPAYIKSVYIVIENLQLGAFGNRIPTLQAQVEEAADRSLGEAIDLLMERANFEDGSWDTSRLSQCLSGMIITGVQTTRDEINPLMVAYGITIQEDENKIVFLSRGEEDRYTISESDLSAHEPSSPNETPWHIRFEDTNDFKVLSEVQLRYTRKENNLQAGSERQQRAVFLSESTLSVDLPITFSSEKARAIAKRMLWESEVQRQRVSLSLPPSFVYLREGNVLVINHGDRDYEFYIQEIQRGDNYLLNLTGVVSLASVYTQEGVDSGSTTNNSNTYVPSELLGYAMDLPALVSEHLEMIGLYGSCCVLSATGTWGGGAVFGSVDGSHYYQYSSLPVEGTIGKTNNAMASGQVWVWDDSTELSVLLYSGTLESCSDDEAFQGINWAAIRAGNTGEWEIVAFVNAETVTSSTFTLSRFLRGLRGTEHLVDKHVPGDPFVLLEQNSSVDFATLDASLLGQSLNAKFPATGALLSEVLAQTVVPKGITKRPFSPVHLNVSEDSGTGDITVSWTRRSKKIFFPFATDSGGLTSDESPETYKIEVRVGGLLLDPIRTLTVSGETSVVYTASQQSDDGVSSSSLRFDVYQYSHDVGYGTPSSVEHIR